MFIALEEYSQRFRNEHSYHVVRFPVISQLSVNPRTYKGEYPPHEKTSAPDVSFVLRQVWCG